jgi:hypothetical protein
MKDDWAENYSKYLEEEDEQGLYVCSSDEDVDGEDALAVLATANKVIQSMHCAFKRRFPEPTQFSINVTFNSLLYSLVGFCRGLGKIDAIPAIDHVMTAMMQLEDELELSSDSEIEDPEIS